MINSEIKLHEKKHINYTELFFQYAGLISIIIFLIIISCGYLFLVKPKIDYVQLELKRDIEILEQKKLVLSAVHVKQVDLQKKYSKINKPLLEKISYMVSEEADFEKVLSDIEERMQGYDVVMTSLSSNSGTDGNMFSGSKSDNIENKVSSLTGLSQMSFKVNLKGPNYALFKNILAMFEKNLRIMDVTNVSFSPSVKSMDLTFSTYYVDLNALPESDIDAEQIKAIEKNERLKVMEYKPLIDIDVSSVNKSNSRLFYPPTKVEADEEDK